MRRNSASRYRSTFSIRRRCEPVIPTCLSLTTPVNRALRRIGRICIPVFSARTGSASQLSSVSDPFLELDTLCDRNGPENGPRAYAKRTCEDEARKECVHACSQRSGGHDMGRGLRICTTAHTCQSVRPHGATGPLWCIHWAHHLSEAVHQEGGGGLARNALPDRGLWVARSCTPDMQPA